MRNPVRNPMLEHSIDEFAQSIADEADRLGSTMEHHKSLGNAVRTRVLTYFIENLLLSSLNKYVNETILTDEEIYKFTKDDFLSLKTDVQNAVAQGFEKAFLAHAGEKMEYYCLVALTPDAINKEPC